MIAKVRFIAVLLLVAAALVPQFSKVELPSQQAELTLAQVSEHAN